MRTQLKLDFRVFSYSVSSTDGYIGAVNTEIEHLLKENNIKKSRLFRFCKHFNVTVLEVLYNHGAKVLTKSK